MRSLFAIVSLFGLFGIMLLVVWGYLPLQVGRMMQEKEEQEFQSGYRAARGHLSFEVNPNREEHLREQWSKGWLKGALEINDQKH